MKNVKIIYLILIFTLLNTSIVYSALNQDAIENNNPENYLTVSFDNAPLSEIVSLISEVTGKPFVISSDEPIKLTWVDQNIFKGDLLIRFNKVITGAGLNLHTIEDVIPIHVIRKTATVIANNNETVGFYHLKNLDPQSLKDTSEILYANTLSVNALENSNVVIFTGSPELVTQFINLLAKIDKPQENDIATIRVKNISVKSAMKALTDTKLIADNTFFPDYWNRSIIVKGTPYERQVALAVIKSVDKPQSGWIDQLEFVRTVNSEAATNIINSVCKNVEVRTISADRILISGFEEDVEKASVLLHKIDGTGLQVKVEAIIAYLTDREFYELGINLNYKNTTWSGSLNKNISNNLVTNNTGLLLNYFKELINIQLAAEKGYAQGEILSSPVLTVANGQEARIHVGQNVPYLSQANFNQNDGSETGTSIQRKDIGITFDVKPTIDPNGEFVHLVVSQEVSNVTDDSELSQNAVDIIVDKKQIKSTVLVADGDTIFLGGLRSEENGKAKNSIPLLSELPLLGRLFTYDVEQKENRNLVVSLRVKVVGKPT